MGYLQQLDGKQIVTPTNETVATDSVLRQREIRRRLRGERPGTVLVVDDDDSIRYLLRLLLEEYGLVVEEASDATGALQMAEKLKDSLSLLVTDVAMPGMSGAELAYTLKRKHLEVPVIFISGYAAGEHLRALFERVTFLQKPFSRTTLINAVHSGLVKCESNNGTSIRPMQ